MEPKKLWEYKNQNTFEVETFHHCKPVYNSWKEFIKDKNALSCNCIYGNPLLYWYWDENPNDEDSDYDFAPELCEENFKRVVLIYRSWFSGMGKIVILVNYTDEPEIRKFIHDAQLTQSVYL